MNRRGELVTYLILLVRVNYFDWLMLWDNIDPFIVVRPLVVLPSALQRCAAIWLLAGVSASPSAGLLSGHYFFLEIV